MPATGLEKRLSIQFSAALMCTIDLRYTLIPHHIDTTRGSGLNASSSHHFGSPARPTRRLLRKASKLENWGLNSDTDSYSGRFVTKLGMARSISDETEINAIDLLERAETVDMNIHNTVTSYDNP